MSDRDMSSRFERMDELHAAFCQSRELNEVNVDLVQTCVVHGLRVDMFDALALMGTMDNDAINKIAASLKARDNFRYSREVAQSYLPDRMVGSNTSPFGGHDG